jgi:hypothetical protein
MPGSAASRHGRDQAQHAQHPERTQHREGLGRRHQRDPDHRKIEQAPGVAEKGKAVDHDARRDLKHEDRKDDVIEDFKLAAEPLHHRLAGFQAQNDGVGDDQRHHRPLGVRVRQNVA